MKTHFHQYPVAWMMLFTLGICVSCEVKHAEEPFIPIQSATQLTNENDYIVYECNERLFAQQNALTKIQAYLPALEKMHVDILWLMPMQVRGDDATTVWSPYCIKDYYTIDPAIGTMDELKALVNDAHQRGMLVMLDWIANHTSWCHRWRTDHPEWYTLAQNGDETQWTDVTFLDYANSTVCDSMSAAMLYWVREADIDGFRCDYAKGVPDAFWQRIIGEVRAIKPNALMLAESDDTKHFSDGFNWLYSWNHMGALQDLYRAKVKAPNAINISLSEMNNVPQGSSRLRYVTNHDATAEAAPSLYYKTNDAMLSAFFLTAFIGGVPMIYSSQEIGVLNQLPICEKTPQPLDFDASNPVIMQYAAIVEAWQRTAKARCGEVQDYSYGRVAVFERQNAGQTILVVVNTSADAQQVALPMSWQYVNCTNLITSQSTQLEKVLDLSAYAYYVLEKK